MLDYTKKKKKNPTMQREAGGDETELKLDYTFLVPDHKID